MKTLTLREHWSNLSAGRKPSMVHFNPDDTAIYFEGDEKVYFDNAQDLLEEAREKKIVISPETIVKYVKQNHSEALKVVPETKEDKKVQKEDTPMMSQDWKNRALSKLSTNTANLQTVKAILKDIIEKL